MNTGFRFLFSLIIPFLFQLNAFSAEPGATPVDQSPWSLLTIQGGATLALQGGGSSMSVVGRVLPSYRIGGSAGSSLSAGLDLGVTAFNNAGAPNFLAWEFGIFSGYRINESWEVLLLAGGQAWSGNNGNAAFVGIEPLYHFRLENLRFVDAAFISYEAVFQKSMASELSAGLQLKF